VPFLFGPVSRLAVQYQLRTSRPDSLHGSRFPFLQSAFARA